MNISNIILPIIILIIISYAIYKKVDLLNTFIEGAKEGIEITIQIFPTILAMLLAINILLKSNFILDFTSILKPILDVLHFPCEILPLAMLKPISGSSSLIVMNELLKTYGTNSYIGYLASVIQGSTDTTIYILSIYFSSIGIKKIKYALKVGLIADLIALISAIVIVNLLLI